MSQKDFARRVLKSADTPLFTTADVSDITGAKPVTIRAWINRGYLRVPFATRPGSGKQMLFAPLDTLEIMALSQMSSLGISPSHFFGKVAESFTSNVLTHFHLIAETEGFEQESKAAYEKAMGKLNTDPEISEHFQWEGFQRYYILTQPMPGHEDMMWVVPANDFSEFKNPFGSISIVADCQDFAEKALALFMEYESEFPTV